MKVSITGDKRSRIRKKLLVTVVASLCFSVSSNSAFAETIQVSTVEDLLQINEVDENNFPTKSHLDFQLANNLDLTGVNMDLQNSYITTSFSGTFDGNGLKIFGLTKPLFIEISSNNREDIAQVSDLILETHPDGLSGQGVLASSIGSNTLIENVHIQGTIIPSIDRDYDVGGIAGSLVPYDLENKSEIKNSTANVEVTGSANVGGIVGTSNQFASIVDSSSSGSVSGGSHIGGLVGLNYGQVINSKSDSSISGSYEVGGIVGWNEGNINVTSSSGTVIGTSSVGGIAGFNNGSIENSFSTGNVRNQEGSFSSFFGGLVGLNYGSVSKTYASGDVTGYDAVGGLIGSLWSGITSNSYAIGNVMGVWNVGGLIGSSNGLIVNSYATGRVTGTYNLGELIGTHYPYWNITNSVSIGCVNENCDPEFFINEFPNILEYINSDFDEENRPFVMDACIDSRLPILVSNTSHYFRSCPSEESGGEDSLEESEGPEASDGRGESELNSDFEFILERNSSTQVKFLSEILSSQGFVASIVNDFDAGFSFLSSATLDIDGVHLVAISENANEELSFQKDDVVQLQVNGEKGSQATLWTTTPNGDEIFLGTITYTEAGTAVLPAMKFSSAGIFALSLRSVAQNPALKTDSTSDLATIKFVIS